MVTQEDLQELLAFDAEGAKVVSLYLDSDTSQPVSYTHLTLPTTPYV